MTSNEKGRIRQERGEKLRTTREKQGLTQTDVANAADISSNYYARIERGEVNPSYEILQNILQALNIKSLDVS